MGKPIGYDNVRLYNSVVNRFTYQEVEISLLHTHPR
jgi:hypothetical protein